MIHYTSLDNAFLIIDCLEIKFSNILYANDACEHKLLEEENESILLFCCSKSPINALSWLAYSGRNHGAAIEFIFKDDNYDDLFFNKAHGEQIVYVIDYYEYIGDNVEQIGLVKDKVFEGEQEFRYIIKTNTIDEPPRFLEMNPKCLSAIVLYVSDQDYDFVKKISNSFKLDCVQVERFEYIR